MTPPANTTNGFAHIDSSGVGISEVGADACELGANGRPATDWMQP